MDAFLSTETLIIELLLVVALVAVAVRRLPVPYTVALVVVGLLITIGRPVAIDLTPELILALFVPPLVFEAAFHLEFARLRATLLPILAAGDPGRAADDRDRRRHRRLGRRASRSPAPSSSAR